MKVRDDWGRFEDWAKEAGIEWAKNSLAVFPGQLRGVKATRAISEGDVRNPSLFFTLVTGPRRSLILKLRDTRVYEPQIRARLGTTAHLCEVVVRNLSLSLRPLIEVH